MRYALAILAALCFVGCGDKPQRPIESSTVETAQPVSVDQWKGEVAKYRKLLSEAEGGLQAAREDAIRVRLWWLIGTMGLLAIGSAALAIFVPSMMSLAIKIGLASASVAALAAVASYMLPYLMLIGVALVVVAILAAIVYWRLDAKSRDQVVRAVDGIKDRVPDYRAHFRQYVDEDADRHLDGVRVRLGLKAKG